jgi:hypothetical protein
MWQERMALSTSMLVARLNIPMAPSSHVCGSPMANADAIAEITLGDLIWNLHLGDDGDDNNDIVGLQG